MTLAAPERPGVVQRAERWWSILRYHHPRQLGLRLWSRVRDRLPTRRTPEAATPELRRREAPLAELSLHRPACDPRKVAAGRLTLLNREFDFGSPIDWNLRRTNAVPPLAAFHLHYHEYLLPLADKSPAAAWRLVQSWIESCPRGSRVAWHPYCISRRIPVWGRLLVERRPPAGDHEAMRACLFHQAHWLARRFERDIGGNHLWENAKALATAGCLFDGPAAAEMLRIGLSTLDACIAEQVSEHGEHFERSPMYQADLANGLFDLASWLQGVDFPAARRMQATAVKMHAFLDELRHPDGMIPLFGDSTLDGDEPRSSGAPTSKWHGDYYIQRTDDGRHLLFDAGDVGPDHLPAHAHSDLLGCELSLFGRRALVDSGVYAYSGGRRNEFRRSSAHNVLTVDGLELADVWSSFRVGRRGHVVRRSSLAAPDGVWIRGSHDAFAGVGVQVERVWFLCNDGPWFSCHLVRGKGERLLAEHLHWHPDVIWHRADGAAFSESFGSPVWFEPCRGQIESEVRTESASCDCGVSGAEQDWIETVGAYSPRFHVEQPNAAWRLERKCSPPATIAWAISFETAPCRPQVAFDGRSLRFEWKQGGRSRSAATPIDA